MAKPDCSSGEHLNTSFVFGKSENKDTGTYCFIKSRLFRIEYRPFWGGLRQHVLLSVSFVLERTRDIRRASLPSAPLIESVFMIWHNARYARFVSCQVLRGFLERNVSRRLGAKKTTMFDIGGATAVKQHPFFQGIDWAKLVALQVEPPLKPELTSQTDTSNFSAEFVDMALPRSLSHESLLGPASLEPSVDEVGEMFRGFSFVADSFIDERDWQDGQESGFSFVERGGDGPNAGVAAVGGAPPKKVKGKRIRKKKAKGVQATAAIEGASMTDVVRVEHVDGDRSATISGAEEHVREPMFVREPVGEVDSKPSTLAAMLRAQQKEKSLSAPNVVPPRPQRPNVWGASSLPAPAPVPTPGRYSAEGGSCSQERRPPPQDVKGLPGHRAGGTFVWKRPV